MEKNIYIFSCRFEPSDECSRAFEHSNAWKNFWSVNILGWREFFFEMLEIICCQLKKNYFKK
jgi:hypothetical protein